MKIKNMAIKTIEARRFVKDFSRPMNIRIDHNSGVKLFSYMGKNEAQIEFEYVASYGGIGIIKFEGDFIFEDDNAEQLAERWQNKKNMPNETASNIHSSIMHYCLPEAVMIARELKLPPPIPMPQIKFNKEGAKGMNRFGPEVA